MRYRRRCLARRLAIAFICGLAGYFPSVSADSVFTHSVITLPFEVQVESPWTRAITSQEEWDAFYREHASSMYVDEESKLWNPPQFDFESYTIIAGGLGSDYWTSTVMIEYVLNSGSTTYVGALILTPGPGCLVTDELQYPTIAILIPEPEDDLQIHSREVINRCG